MRTGKTQNRGTVGTHRCILSLFAVLLAICPLPGRAQVTIGATEPPVAGALLDLKETGTTNKGLGMPRVRLTSLTIPSNQTLAQTIDGNATTDNWDKDDHIGLTVYNTNVCIDGNAVPDGLYVWDGDQWQYLGASVAYSVTDPRDGEVYLASNFGAAGDWMVENMRYIDDSKMTAKAGDSNMNSSDKYYTYPQSGSIANPGIKPASWRPAYGLLYTYSAATLGRQDNVNVNQGQNPGDEPSGNEVELNDKLDGPDADGYYFIQGICPDGWHIPSDREWNELEKELYDHADLYSTYDKKRDLPFIAKYEGGETYDSWRPEWETGRNQNNPSSNTIGGAEYRGSTGTKGHGFAIQSPCPVKGSSPATINGTSLSAVRGGFATQLAGVASGGSVSNYGQYAYFWSSSVEYQGTTHYYAWYRIVSVYLHGVGVNRQRVARHVPLYSVRCKKD